jgi:hypothetical protein
MAVSLCHVLFENMASGEVVTDIILSIQLILLTILFPWFELWKVTLVA